MVIKDDEGSCRAWTQVYNRHDGSFLIRYKLYNTCKNLNIDVKYNNTQHLAESPYYIKGETRDQWPSEK